MGIRDTWDNYKSSRGIVSIEDTINCIWNNHKLGIEESRYELNEMKSYYSSSIDLVNNSDWSGLIDFIDEITPTFHVSSSIVTELDMLKEDINDR